MKSPIKKMLKDQRFATLKKEYLKYDIRDELSIFKKTFGLQRELNIR